MHEELPEPLLRTEQVAELLNLTPKALEAWRWRRMGPPWFKLRGAVRYRASELSAWLERQRRGGPADAAPEGHRG